jgi:hypothetical protein
LVRFRQPPFEEWGENARSWNGLLGRFEAFASGQAQAS